MKDENNYPIGAIGYDDVSGSLMMKTGPSYMDWDVIPGTLYADNTSFSGTTGTLNFIESKSMSKIRKDLNIFNFIHEHSQEIAELPDAFSAVEWAIKKILEM